MNNYEKIKAMTLDEIAAFINRLKMNVCEDAFIAGGCNGCYIKGLCDLPKSKTKLWLQQESKG